MSEGGVKGRGINGKGTRSGGVLFARFGRQPGGYLPLARAVA